MSLHDDKSACSHEKIQNPYLKTIPSSRIGKMGLQSQQRVGSIKKCKKVGSRFRKLRFSGSQRLVQRPIGGAEAFIPELHCQRCIRNMQKAAGLILTVPHRSHDKRCQCNRLTRGVSVYTVEVNRIAQANLCINDRPPALDGQTKGTSIEQKLEFFQGKGMSTTMASMVQNGQAVSRATVTAAATVPDSIVEVKKTPNESKKDIYFDGGDGSLGLELRQELERRLAHLDDKQSKSYTRLSNLVKCCRAPKAVALLFDYISDETRPGRRGKNSLGNLTFDQVEARSRRSVFFPEGSCLFSFPRDPSIIPSPHYHSVQGVTISLSIGRPCTQAFSCDVRIAKNTYDEIERISHTTKHYFQSYPQAVFLFGGVT